MTDNVLVEKSLEFAVKIIELYRYLTQHHKEFVISKQIVRCGTSIGANINEANYGQSRADFISKMHIALKETAETEYWIRVLTRSAVISRENGEALLRDCLDMKRILVASINTAKKNK